MRTYHRLVFRDCTAFSAALESSHCGAGVRAALARGEVIEVQGHRFRLCRSESGWKIRTAPFWQMTHRQRFARLMRHLCLGGDEVLWEARVRRFVKRCAIRVETQGSGDGARPRVLPLYLKGWLPPPVEQGGTSAISREAGLQRRAELLRYGTPPAARGDRASEGTSPVSPPRRPVIPAGIDLRRLCPDVAATLFGQGADLQGRNLRDSDLGSLDLKGANLRDAVLLRCRAREAVLSEADLQGADLRFADLRGARLDGAKLQRAQLAGARLQNARLDGADLRGQSLDVAALAGATLRDAMLDGAELVLADDVFCSSARTALLKPLDQPDGNLLWTLSSLPTQAQRRNLMIRIVQALSEAMRLNHNVADTHAAVAQVLLRHAPDYWSDPRDPNAKLSINVWMQAIARHQCRQLTGAVPDACVSAVADLAKRYLAMFGALSGGQCRWSFQPPERLLEHLSSTESRSQPQPQSSLTPVSSVNLSTTGR